MLWQYQTLCNDPGAFRRFNLTRMGRPFPNRLDYANYANDVIYGQCGWTLFTLNINDHLCGKLKNKKLN